MRDQVGAIAVVQAGKDEDQEAVRIQREGGSKCYSEDRTNRTIVFVRQEG